MADDPTGPTLDEEGVPDLEGPLPGKAATGDPQEGAPPPRDRAASRDWGTTEAEQRHGEPLSVRVDRERPDLDDPQALAERTGADTVLAEEHAGLTDDEKDAVGRVVDQSGQLVGPEERAMHIVSDPDDGDVDRPER